MTATTTSPEVVVSLKDLLSGLRRVNLKSLARDAGSPTTNGVVGIKAERGGALRLFVTDGFMAASRVVEGRYGDDGTGGAGRWVALPIRDLRGLLTAMRKGGAVNVGVQVTTPRDYSGEGYRALQLRPIGAGPDFGGPQITTANVLDAPYIGADRLLDVSWNSDVPQWHAVVPADTIAALDGFPQAKRGQAAVTLQRVVAVDNTTERYIIWRTWDRRFGLGETAHVAALTGWQIPVGFRWTCDPVRLRSVLTSLESSQVRVGISGATNTMVFRGADEIAAVAGMETAYE